MANRNLIQAIKFTLFSLSAGIIQIITEVLCLEVIRFEAYVSYLIALIASVIYNFTVNRRFTFKSAKNVPIAMLQTALYYLVFTPVSTLWTKYFTENGINEYLVLGITMIINFITEFLFCKFVIYRNNEYTNDLAKREEEKA